MKKLVGIVLTTGLLMGTVAFGALACERDDSHNRFQEQEQKRMEQHERYQPPKDHNDHMAEKVVVSGIKAICDPGPGPAPMVKPPVPRPEHPERDYKGIPQPVPERHDHNRQLGPRRPGDPEQIRQVGEVK